MTHEFKDAAGDTYLIVDASQPVIIDHQRPLESNVQFHSIGTEPFLVIGAGGKVTWNGREVVGDEEFKQAMMDLNVKLQGINKTIQPAMSDAEIRKYFDSENGLENCSMCHLDDFVKVYRAIEAHCRGGASHMNNQEFQERVVEILENLVSSMDQRDFGWVLRQVRNLYEDVREAAKQGGESNGTS